MIDLRTSERTGKFPSACNINRIERRAWPTPFHNADRQGETGSVSPRGFRLRGFPSSDFVQAADRSEIRLSLLGLSDA